MVKALGAGNVVTTGEILACVLGVWRGLSRLDRILRRVFGQVLLGGCDLGIPYERYLWQVHV